MYATVHLRAWRFYKVTPVCNVGRLQTKSVSIPLVSAYPRRVSPTHPSIELHLVVVPYARQTA